MMKSAIKYLSKLNFPQILYFPDETTTTKEQAN